VALIDLVVAVERRTVIVEGSVIIEIQEFAAVGERGGGLAHGHPSRVVARHG
jgi:hypothetical protein